MTQSHRLTRDRSLVFKKTRPTCLIGLDTFNKAPHLLNSLSFCWIWASTSTYNAWHWCSSLFLSVLLEILILPLVMCTHTRRPVLLERQGLDPASLDSEKDLLPFRWIQACKMHSRKHRAQISFVKSCLFCWLFLVPSVVCQFCLTLNQRRFQAVGLDD